MPHRILIIDDEDDISRSSRAQPGDGRRLAGLHGQLRALRAWRAPSNTSPTQSCFDVMMPGMDGPTTFRELRKNPATARIPVLLLTAKVQSSDQRRFADLGVEAILFKPFDPLHPL